MNSRAAAARVINDVMENGRSLSDCLTEAADGFSDSRDQALLQAICFGVCRHSFSLRAKVDSLLEKPLKQKDGDIYALLLTGIYQLTQMRIPAYAAVADTVAAVTHLKKIWAKGLVNAVLRNFQRSQVSSAQADDTVDEEVLYDHPQWMIDKIKHSYPQECVAIFAANNQHPPFALRVNQRRISRERYMQKLAAQDALAAIIPATESGIILSAAQDVNTLPGFANGDVSVQDGAAQLAATLLDLQPAMRVLDACAAPGGKTAHIAELQPQLAQLIAVDHDVKRLASVKENMRRLRLSANCIQADATDLDSWWDGWQFDRILLDAPCSATGVIRRHPDIKLLRRASDVQKLSVLQNALLESLWKTLKPGGLLVYVTCSIFPDENNDMLTRFIAKHSDAKEEVITADWGRPCSIGRQILPGMHDMDGFYFARLRKC